jgi:Holliday junction resolvasome RuvABC endonuclease subunit
MKVIAFDQSTSITGYSIWIDYELNNYGKLIVENPKKKNPWTRIMEMYWLIFHFLDNEKPDFVGFEGIQYQGGISTLQVLAEMRGALASKLFEMDVGFEDIMPTEWKGFCNIEGKDRITQKANTIQMVKEKFGLDVSEDEADSIGLGMFLNNILITGKRWLKKDKKKDGKK